MTARLDRNVRAAPIRSVAPPTTCRAAAEAKRPVSEGGSISNDRYAGWLRNTSV